MDETLQRWMRESEEIGEKRGEKRGRREGEKLGAKNEKIKIASDLKKRGFKDELIAEITGLSKKMIMALTIPNL